MNIEKIKERIGKLEEKKNQERLENTSRRANMAENVRNTIISEINLNKKLIAIHEQDEYPELKKIISISALKWFNYERKYEIYAYAKNSEVIKIPLFNELFILGENNKCFLKENITSKMLQNKSIELGGILNEWQIDSLIKDVKLWESFGFKSIDDYNNFRNKLNSIEFNKVKKDPIKELEAKLVGNKGIGIDFFPTPIPVCEKMCELAELISSDKVLEPSAGNGNICDAINSFGVNKDNIDACEISFQLKELLTLKGYNIITNDFMDLCETKKYNKIIMNPPFCADTEHIRKAFEHLEENGILVSIISVSAMNNNTKKYIEFREWLDNHISYKELLESGTFNDNKLLSRTMVSSYLIVLNK